MPPAPCESPDVRIHFLSKCRVIINDLRVRARHTRKTASEITSPVNTEFIPRPSISVNEYPNLSQGQRSEQPSAASMGSASHPPGYPQRRDEEQTGAEIATKVLGRNSKPGQAPFYTGLY
jgi:hypothetical protein